MNTPRQLRCAIYTRKSTEEGLQQDFNSLDAQREACEAYIASQKSCGWIHLNDHFDDGGFSGGTLERPGIQRLLREIEAGMVDVVVVYKIDRLSRSLMDFAKLVEIFDRRSVTFVSVTQSFNTTTSMGRLTLNVLLSFAQFEREVIGERVRDKVAASKRKGMWMGGRPPLGYDVANLKLIINPTEAKTVNVIFQRYLDLGCVRALRSDLIATGIKPKAWTSRTGRECGSTSFSRGALYCLLKNRIYLGETMHKSKSYKGQHDAIVTRELFAAVQERFAATRRRTLGGASVAQGAALSGLVFNADGIAMLPAYTMKPNGGRYDYYACRRARMAGQVKDSISRVPAIGLEKLLARALMRLGLLRASEKVEREFRPFILRVDILPDVISVRLDRDAVLARWRAQGNTEQADRTLLARHREELQVGEKLTDDQYKLTVTLPICTRSRGRQKTIHLPVFIDQPGSKPNAPLIRALANAHRWKAMLTSGEVSSVGKLAAKLGKERKHVGQVLRLAFLAPDLVQTILRGEQDARIRLAHLLNADIPVFWVEQRALFKRIASSL